MIDVRVEWTGSWPRMCQGRWIFEVDGKDYRYLLPFANDDGFDIPAGTENEYEHWTVDTDGEREWYHYTDGLDIDEWCDMNRDWLEVITPNEHDWDDIFFAFQEHDWRFKQCGGCITVPHKSQWSSIEIDPVLDIEDDLLDFCTSGMSRETMGVHGAQYRFEFPNGYGASVVKDYGSYGWENDLWEMALTINERLVYVNDFEWDVIGNLSDKGVNELLRKIKNYKEVAK